MSFSVYSLYTFLTIFAVVFLQPQLGFANPLFRYSTAPNQAMQIRETGSLGQYKFAMQVYSLELNAGSRNTPLNLLMLLTCHQTKDVHTIIDMLIMNS